ncbi:type II toxin-antitoxin system RelE/ParE family toxin [Desulfovibrio sp. OttesenSCG-928-M14]|nr:type II toxin-antitoxin system RelE/ParE family toxin [Desulfovibrio sp. OttesenSCG-928-M14]
MLPRNPLPIEWTESAFEDMNGIADYLLGESLPFDAVEDYVRRIYNAPEYLTTLPGAGKPGRMPNTREWLVKGTPYALIYRVLPDRVQILRVMHGSRQFSEQ